MTNRPIDTDASGPFAVGTGTSQPSTDFRSIQPNWLADGYGVRGPQRPVDTERARPRELNLGQAVGQQRSDVPPSAESCNPGEGADDTIKYIKATQWNSGESRWECVWLPTCASTCD